MFKTENIECLSEKKPNLKCRNHLGACKFVWLAYSTNHCRSVILISHFIMYVYYLVNDSSYYIIRFYQFLWEGSTDVLLTYWTKALLVPVMIRSVLCLLSKSCRKKNPSLDLLTFMLITNSQYTRRTHKVNCSKPCVTDGPLERYLKFSDMLFFIAQCESVGEICEVKLDTSC